MEIPAGKLVIGKVLSVKRGKAKKVAGYKLKPLGVVHEKRSGAKVSPAVHAAKA